MAHDFFKPTGSTRASTPYAGGANARIAPVIAIVKDNIDPIRAGRLQVYISDNSGLDPDDRKNWVTVSYLSPFYGFVRPTAGDSTYGDFKTNPSSYGFWNSPPDIGTRVICIFVDGDMNYGYYIGCIPEPEALTMVPAIGATENIIPNKGEAQGYGGALRLPVTNININNANIADSINYLDEPKPVHSYTAMIMAQQGIIRDPIRGPISSSSQRETPSRVGWGISTPGRPIYSGGFDDASIAKNLDSGKNKDLQVVSRRGGHSIVMDDGDIIGQDQLVRIRTALGHQILMSDSGQTLMILHSNGQSYIELGKEGTVDVYSTNSINLRTQGDLNLHADNNINLHAAKQLNIQAEQIQVSADKDFLQRTGENHRLHVLGQMTSKIDKQMSFESGGESSFASKDITYINGKKINLNTGASSTKPGDVKPIPIIAHTDTLHDETKGFAAAPGKLLSITSRAPAHYPWANAGQGVNVKVDLGAAANLPSAPSPSVEAINQASLGAVTDPVSVAVAATMPVTPAASAALDKNATSATLGAIAKEAATGPFSEVIKQGAGVVDTVKGKIAAVGSFAATPTELEKSNFIKPGAAALVQNLVNQGVSVKDAMTSNLFTGKPGGEDLSKIVNNVTAQATCQVSNLTDVQKQLQTAGVITGKEAPQQIAGLVMSGVKEGVLPTINAVKGFTTGAISTVVAANSVAGSVLKSVGAGSYAASLSQTLTGGLGGITKALNIMNQAQGIAGLMSMTQGVSAGAFASILSSFVPLKAGVPQNLAAIAATAGSAIAKIGAGAPISNVAASSAASLLAATTRMPAPVTTAIAGTIGALTSSTLSGTVGGLASTASGLASGVNNLPGGQKVVSAVINNAAGALTALPGGAPIAAAIKSISAANMNGLPNPIGLSTNSLTSLLSAGLPPAAAAQLNSAMAALGSAGAIPIKLPTVGLNTTERGSLTSQISSLLGDPGIPRPNLTGEVSQEAKTTVNSLREAQVEELMSLNSQRGEWLKRIANAREAYNKAFRSYPSGAPEIDEAKKLWFELLNNPEYLALQERAKQITG